MIIPVLNEENYLPHLLVNLADQSFRNFETIIVDGNSEDNTLKYARGFCARLPKLQIEICDVRNVAYQRNLGTRHAHGKYLVFLEADMQIPGGFLQSIFSIIDKYKSKLLVTWIAADTPKLPARIITSLTNILIVISGIINRPFGGGYNTIVDYNLYNKVGGFREDMSLGDDYDFVMKAAKAGGSYKIVRNPKIIYSLRRFYKDGYLATFALYFKATVLLFLKGPDALTRKKIFYPMGGQVFKN